MAFDETAVIAKDFCQQIVGMPKAQFPQHSGRRDREIHVYGTDGKTVRYRFNFMDLNEVMKAAKIWCDLKTQQQVREWEIKNGKAADQNVWADCRMVLEILYNNFETMEFYVCIWSRHTQIIARAYKNNTAVKAIMRACLNAQRVLNGETYDAVHDSSSD